jgi:predicted permease
MRLPIELPVQIDLRADRAIIGFAFVISLVVGVLVGLAPVRFATRVDLNASFRSSGSFRLGNRRMHARDLLVGIQVALCVVLLHACFMAVRGLQHAAAGSIGWNPDGLVMASTDLGLARYDAAKVATFYRRLVEEARQLPGVRAAAVGDSLPLYADRSTTTAFAEPSKATDAGVTASTYTGSPGYFRTLEIPLRYGRDFSESDTATSPPVVVINRSLAVHLFGRADAVGERLRSGRGGSPIEVVGVVEDGKYISLGEARSFAIFRPNPQSFTRSTMIFARVTPGSGVTARDLRQLLLRLDPSLPIRIVATGDDIAAFPLFPYRTAVAALGVMGLIASGLLLTGLHALMAYAAARRQREIGVRLALGANRRTVARLVLGRAALMLAGGVGAGALLTLGTGPLVSSLVLGASPADPVLLVGLGLVLALIVLVSCFGPVRRALRITPLAALRED